MKGERRVSPCRKAPGAITGRGDQSPMAHKPYQGQNSQQGFEGWEAVPEEGGVLVLYGKHKGVFGSLVERNTDKDTGVVRDADSHDLIKVRLDAIAELGSLLDMEFNERHNFGGSSDSDERPIPSHPSSHFHGNIH
ncbi:hypothetical protein MUK42_19367 [Musa troglodytarum]|nr:hypothetical protein MUK42_19367 [Musa troglodytarum]